MHMRALKKSAGDAEVKAQAEREANSLGFYLQNQNNSDANQRRQDAESIKEALSLLKALVAMVKVLGWNDPESRKELEKINNLIKRRREHRKQHDRQHRWRAYPG